LPPDVSVTCAKSPRQVINVLNCEGAETDIILAEVDLPVSKCFKMLKYIARNKELRHIPIISKPPFQFHSSFQCSNSCAMLCSDDMSYQWGHAVMSNRDDVSVVVKCLRLGAAEYLVKPLRMNELLNLWTHVWRRRRMVNGNLF
jgi:pseudo-response regulator 1